MNLKSLSLLLKGEREQQLLFEDPLFLRFVSHNGREIFTIFAEVSEDM